MLNRLQKSNKDGITSLSVMYNDLAIMHFQKKEYEKSLDYFTKSINYLDELLSQELLKNQDTETPIVKNLQEQIIYIKNKIVELSDILGQDRVKKEDYLGAIEYYKLALSYYADKDSILFNLGACLYESGAFNSAMLFLKRSIEINPECSPAYKFISEIYNHKLKDYTNAIIYLEKYVQRIDNDAMAFNSLAHLYETVSPYENLEKIIMLFEKALEINPKLMLALRNLAVVYPRVGRDRDAVECFHRLFKLGPTKRDFFNYACQMIRLRDFKEGWTYYEHRFEIEDGATIYPKMNKPKWNGKKIPNKTLLVQYEQGFGDSVQFLRYLPQLASLAQKIIFRVQDELVDLFKINVKGNIEVVGKSTPLEDIKFDFHVPIMSLPYFLKATVEDIPLSEGYIKPDENKKEEFRKKFFDNDCFKIGISWHGAENGRKNRNIPLSFFAPLAKLKKVKVYSFQKFVGSEELRELPQNIEIVDLGREFNDFSDTAAAMANLDLFVTSDNSVFNLAGAMAQKTFLLIPNDSEWRWFFDDDTTPWYDSVRIIKKQNELDSWAVSIQRIIDILLLENGDINYKQIEKMSAKV